MMPVDCKRLSTHLIGPAEIAPVIVHPRCRSFIVHPHCGSLIVNAHCGSLIVHPCCRSPTWRPTKMDASVTAGHQQLHPECMRQPRPFLSHAQVFLLCRDTPRPAVHMCGRGHGRDVLLWLGQWRRDGIWCTVRGQLQADNEQWQTMVGWMPGLFLLLAYLCIVCRGSQRY